MIILKGLSSTENVLMRILTPTVENKLKLSNQLKFLLTDCCLYKTVAPTRNSNYTKP